MTADQFSVTRSSEYVVTSLNLSAAKKSDFHFDHATSLKQIRARIAQLETWLNHDENEDLVKKILSYESKRDGRFFMEKSTASDTGTRTRLVATGYFLNHYFNDVDNLSPLSAELNTFKGSEELQALLVVHVLYGEAFKEAVEKANTNANKYNTPCIDLISTKVGARPAYRIPIGNGEYVNVTQGGVGLAKFAQDWLQKRHPEAMDYAVNWQSIYERIRDNYLKLTRIHEGDSLQGRQQLIVLTKIAERLGKIITNDPDSSGDEANPASVGDSTEKSVEPLVK